MGPGSMSAVARGLVAVLGVAVAAATVGLAEPGVAGYATTYGDHSTLFRSLEVVVGLALLAAGLALLPKGSTGLLGLFAVVAMTAWVAPVWVGWEGAPVPARSVALAVAPVLAAAVLGVAMLLPPAARGRGRRVIAAVAAITVVVCLTAGVALVVARDPLRDIYCWTDCTVAPVGDGFDVERARRLARLVLTLVAATGVATVIVCATRLARVEGSTRRRSAPGFGAAALTGLALSAYAVALHVEPRELPDRSLYAWLFAARAIALLALAAALGWVALRPRIVRGRVRRLAVDLERTSAPGGLGEALALALDDPGLTLAFPLRGDDRVVDDAGRVIELATAARVTPIVGAEGVVAYVLSARADVGELESELGPAAHLAIGNERLRAMALAGLMDVTRSRARIVEATDAARRRMERDLHDGAQQRMLALTYDLRVALTVAEASGNRDAAAALRAALGRATDAAAELRDIAHGIFPAELAASGLEAALESLADVRPVILEVRLPPGRRFPDEIEAAAYAVVADVAAGDAPLDVTVLERDGSLVVAVEGGGSWSGGHALALVDRIGAVGGTLTVDGGRLEAVLPV